jgi:hypothetical protein
MQIYNQNLNKKNLQLKLYKLIPEKNSITVVMTPRVSFLT